MATNAMASVRAPKDETREYSDDDKYIEAAKSAIEEDNAEVIGILVLVWYLELVIWNFNFILQFSLIAPCVL